MVREKEDRDEDQVSGVFQGLGQGSNSKDRIRIVVFDIHMQSIFKT